MTDRLAAAARRRFADAGVRREVEELRTRVERLERENVDLRRHGLRAAEVLDIAVELLVPVAQQDPDAARAAIERYREGL